MSNQAPYAPLVVATFLARYLADKEEGSLRTLEEYRALFPGYEAVIDREWEGLKRADRDADRGKIDGRSIGKYVIEQELGRGGQGVVYRAHDTELRRSVALKVLPAGLARTSEMRRRLFREAEAASRLDDPGICTVYEAGEHEGVAFIAMRLVEGESLAEHLSRQRAGDAPPQSEALMLDTMPDAVPARREPGVRAAPRRPDKVQIGEFVRLIADCADILHRTHEAGLVHRDIKPGNVMISADGSPVVLDFGLARMEDHPDGSLTEDGDVLGTPAYMSPEQLRDHHSVIDRRTDVYSLAVTLYECLTLRRPFEAPTRERLYMQILGAEPMGASRWNPEIDKDLAVVIACAMDKDRARRYRTCAEFSKDLRCYLNGEPVAARPVSPWTRSLRWVQRHPAVTAGVTLIVAASVSFALWQSSTSQELRKRARTTDAMRRAILAKDLAKDDIDTALSEAATAVHMAPSLETRSAYYEVLSSAPERTVLPVTSGPSLCRIDPSGTRGVVIDPRGRRIDVWDLQTLERVNSVQLKRQPIGRPPMAFSREAVAVALNAREGASAVWVVDLTRSAEPVVLEHAQPVGALAFSPEGDELVIGAAPLQPNPSAMEVTVGVWKPHQGEALQVLEPKLATSIATCGFFSGTDILAATEGGRVQRWRRDATGTRVADRGTPMKLPGGYTPQTGIGWGYDDQGAIIIACAHGVRVLRLDGAQLPDPRNDERGSVTGNARGIFATGAWGNSSVALTGQVHRDMWYGGLSVQPGTVSLWNLSNGRHLLTCGSPEDLVVAADVGVDRVLATVQVNGSVSLWSESGLLINNLGGPGRPIFDAAISLQGRIALMSTDRGLEFIRLPWHGSVVAFAPDGQVLALGPDGDLVMARASARGPRVERRLPAPSVGSLVGLSSGTVSIKGHVAVAKDDRVHIWRPDGSLTSIKKEGHAGTLAFSPDASMLAMAGQRGASVLDVDTGEVTRSWSTEFFEIRPRVRFLSPNRVLVSTRFMLRAGTHILTLDAPPSDIGDHLAVKILGEDDAGRTAVGFRGGASSSDGDVVIVDLVTLEIRAVDPTLDGYRIVDAVMSSDGRTFAVAQHAIDKRVLISWHDTADLRLLGTRALETWGLCATIPRPLSRIPGEKGLVYMDGAKSVMWVGITMDDGPRARIGVGHWVPTLGESWVTHDPQGQWLAFRSYGGARFIPVNALAHASAMTR